MIKVIQVKVSSGRTWLNAAAREVNQVWNWANEVSYKAIRPFSGSPHYLGRFELGRLSVGAYKEFEFIGSGTIEDICHQFAVKRKAARSPKLRWRSSFGGKKSLGWIPFKGAEIQFKDGHIVFHRRCFRVFDSYGLDQYELRAGNFAQNSLGEWFLNIAVRSTAQMQEIPTKAVGVDLGLKATATCSDGLTLYAGRFYRDSEQKIAQAQRRGHKRQAKRRHLQAKNRRKDALHKFSSLLVKQNGCIYVGDVSSAKLVKTKMAKSVLDSGWGMLKTMLLYKSHRAGSIVEIVNERNTTRVCSSCGCFTGPSGLRQLVVREWSCSECGAEHLRDVNAARNILALGNQRPLAGTSLGVFQ